MPKTETTYRRFTKEEYFDLLERSEERFEYWDGLIYSMYHAEPIEDLSDHYIDELMAKVFHPYNHSAIISNIVMKLSRSLEEYKYKVYSEGRSVLFTAEKRFVYPDIVIVERDKEETDPETGFLINPQVVMEILSRSTQHRDLHYKMQGYAQVSGLSEYLTIEQGFVKVEHLQKEGPAWLPGVIYTELTHSAFLESLDCELPLADIYRGVNLE